MKRAFIAIKISIACFFITFICILLNEGILSLSSSESLMVNQQIRIWRNDCNKVPYKYNQVSSGAMATASASKIDYFSSHLNGVIRLTSNKPTPISGKQINAKWSFFNNCNNYMIDMSDFTNIELLDVKAAYPDPKSNNIVYIQGDISQTQDNIYLINFDIKNKLSPYFIELSLMHLLSRASASEFGFNGYIPTVLFSENKINDSVLSSRDLNKSKDFLGGAAVSLSRTGHNQQTNVSNNGREVPTKLWFGDLNDMYKLLSLLLSILLGIWIGTIFESLLVLTTLNEIKKCRD
ncbi:MAG: hypothetical protein QM500_04015 [Methylococcales bacterium]